jgi:hypothetical protein
MLGTLGTPDCLPLPILRVLEVDKSAGSETTACPLPGKHAPEKLRSTPVASALSHHHRSNYPSTACPPECHGAGRGSETTAPSGSPGSIVFSVTVLRMRGLRTRWNERMFRRLCTRLARLLSPSGGEKLDKLVPLYESLGSVMFCVERLHTAGRHGLSSIRRLRGTPFRASLKTPLRPHSDGQSTTRAGRDKAATLVCESVRGGPLQYRTEPFPRTFLRQPAHCRGWGVDVVLPRAIAPPPPVRRGSFSFSARLRALLSLL